MARYAIKTLEFDKVKNILADKTATSLGRQAVGAMRIESEFAKVKRLQEETAEALHSACGLPVRRPGECPHLAHGQARPFPFRAVSA